MLVPVGAFSQGTSSECHPIRQIPPAQLCFQDGEKLTFVAKYTWGIVDTNVGELTTKVSYHAHDTEPWFHAQASVRTYSFFDKLIIKIRDTYEARFRATDITPLYFYRDIHEGKYTIQNRFNFLEDHKIEAQVIRSNNRIRDTVMQGRPCTFDVMSLFYFARNIDVSGMKVGEQFTLSFVIDEEMHDLYFRFMGVENKKVQGVGTFRCRKFAVSLVAGVVFTGKEEMVIWMSDDNNQLPVWLESPVVVGKVVARISKYEGLKFPLTSKIK
jgi:hypothetical protein